MGFANIAGSYSYVAVGASAKTYDALAAPVRRRVLWAGEHTCKEHPDTVGGAMLTGMREVAVPAFCLQPYIFPHDSFPGISSIKGRSQDFRCSWCKHFGSCREKKVYLREDDHQGKKELKS
jgi:hypothetical protein